jgi:GT2 family glycosyltransferase
VSEAAPAVSVVIPAFNAREGIGHALASLYRQKLEEPLEIIVVASGSDGCAEYLEGSHPSVRVVQSRGRLLPGPARNAGVRAARGEIVAFASADTRAAPLWAGERLRVHRAGFDLVGGSILNGTPWSWIGTAGYLLEYSALLPVEALLRRQGIAHALSFSRSVFELVGEYPEDVLTGEDTIFNQRCLDSGLRLGFAPAAGLRHDNPTRLAEFLTHAANHGRGLAQCIERHDLSAAIRPSDASTLGRRIKSAATYTALGLFAKYRRIARYAPRWLPTLVLCTPLIVSASAVTAWSSLVELGVDRGAEGEDADPGERPGPRAISLNRLLRRSSAASEKRDEITRNRR